MNLTTLQLISVFSTIIFIGWAVPYMATKSKEREEKTAEKAAEKIENLSKKLDKQTEELNKRKFTKKEFLTENESKFLKMFVTSEITRKEFNIHPQVAMGAIIQAYRNEDREEFDKKIVDFLVCDKKSKKIYCVIELDGKEHQEKQMSDLERDKMLEAAGIKTLRFKNEAIPKPEEIKRQILNTQWGTK